MVRSLAPNDLRPLLDGIAPVYTVLAFSHVLSIADMHMRLTDRYIIHSFRLRYRQQFTTHCLLENMGINERLERIGRVYIFRLHTFTSNIL